MSRIGKKPIPMPAGVTVTVTGNDVVVEGKNGRLSMTHRPEVTVTVDGDAKQVLIERIDETKDSSMMQGLTRALINNMVVGVSEGFTRELDIIGVGWNGQVKGKKIELNVGYADTKVVEFPDNVNVEVNAGRIRVTGPDKQAVGQVAANIRSQRKPEPYQGKGIKYVEEVVTRKPGKQFAGGG